MIDVNTLTNIIIYGVVLLFIGFLIGIGVLSGKFIGINFSIIYGFAMFIFILIVSVWFCNNVKKDLRKPINPELHKKLYNMMEYFDNLCGKNKIKYWSQGGTTLGMVRNKGIIPHDDDIDVAMLQKDFDKLMKLSDKLKQDGYQIFHYTEKNIKNNPLGLNLYKMGKINDESLWIDIFIYIKDKDKYIFKDKISRSSWPAEWYVEKELFPLKRYTFGKLKIYGPNKPKKYLDRAYPEWHKIVLDFPHTDISAKKILTVTYNRLGLLP